MPERQIVMVIRHGEKPAGKGRPHGVDADGTRASESLSPRGWARAGALIGLFAPADARAQRRGLVRPAELFASNVHGPGGGSRRQEESVSLLAETLGVSTDLRFGVGEEAALVDAVHRARGPVLVCWEHRRIPVIGAALGHVSPPVPSGWPKSRFDMVWVFTPSGHDGYVLSQVPELLLPGDSAEPIT